MIKIFKYSLYDMIRNRWMFYYMGFFLILTTALLFLSSELTQVIVTLTNIILAITPLIGILFGIIYYYNSKEFIELLLTQPVTRRSVFAGVYLGLASSLGLSLFIGVSLPLLFYGILASELLGSYLTLIFLSILLSIIFSIIAFIIAIKFDNKVRGFGTAICLWLFFALLYDGIFLILLIFFKEYPLDNLTIALSMLNPIGLARTLIILQLDISAMMGYSGAVIKKFLGSSTGSFMISTVLLIWTCLPMYLMLRRSDKKDF